MVPKSPSSDGGSPGRTADVLVVTTSAGDNGPWEPKGVPIE